MKAIKVASTAGRLTLMLFAVVLSMVFLAVTMNWLLVNSDAASTAATINSFQSELLLWRIGLLLALFLFWPFLAKKFAAVNEFDAETTRAFIDQRWRMAMWLIVVDLVIIEELPAKLFDLVVY